MSDNALSFTSVKNLYVCDQDSEGKFLIVKVKLPDETDEEAVSAMPKRGRKR